MSLLPGRTDHAAKHRELESLTDPDAIAWQNKAHY